jgi:tetratricopeptide (TPR) repeat protein
MASRSRNPEVRIQALEALLADDPASPAFFPLAGLIWEKGEADKAVDMLTTGLQHNPVYSAPRVLLGEIYLAKEQVTEAIDELEKAVARTPWNLAAQRFLLDCFQKTGDDIGARKARMAIGMFDPADEEAFAALDGAQASPVVPSPGPPILDEAPLEEPLDAIPTPSLAELYVSQGHIDKALEVYTSLVEEDPENTEYMEKVTELQAKLAEGEGALDDALGDDDSAADELEDFNSILEEAEGTAESVAEAAEDASDDGLDDFDSIFDETEDTADADEPELEDFDSLLEEAEGATDDGAPELEDFDSILEEAEAVAESPEEELGDEARGGLDNFDSLLAEERDAFAADAVAATVPEAADEPEGEEDDLDALFADEPGEASRAKAAPAAEKAGDDLDALFADEPGEASRAKAAPAAGNIGDDMDAQLAEEFGEPEGADGEEMPVAEAEDEVSALEETPVAEVDDETGGTLDEFESLLAEEPEAVAEEIPVAEAEDEVSALEETPVVGEAPKTACHIMQGIIEVYLQEGNYETALDVCRKAILVGSSSEWLVMQIQELEAIISERMKRDLPQPAEEDIEDAAPEPPTDSEVVKSLLGWLDTVQRRQTKLSAGSQRGPSRDMI